MWKETITEKNEITTIQQICIEIKTILYCMTYWLLYYKGHIKLIIYWGR